MTVDDGGWACQSACTGPVAQLSQLGEIEIKAEEIRAQVCINRDLAEDAAVPLEAWVASKAQRYFRQVLNQAFFAVTELVGPWGS